MSGKPSIDCTRRALLGAIGLAVPAQAALTAGTAADPSPEYGWEPGLSYLNTASLGPTRRHTPAKQAAPPSPGTAVLRP
jgi:hypothetical protein